jgi:D-alanyl-D-alanine carboxypeptidase
MTASPLTVLRQPLAVVAIIAALAASVLVGSVIGPAAARAVGPLPACRYADLLTSPRGYGDWSITLVDTILSLTPSYVPPDLVSVSEAGLSGDGRVRAIVIDDLRAVQQAASAAGAAIGVESAYRSYAEQKQVFDAWVKQYGYDRALMTPARPGHSEHQLGVAIDFRSDAAGPPVSGNFGNTAAGKWMAAHGWEYGFVMSYPKGATAVTCYDTEPWHFRYVGRDLAAQVHASGAPLRAYLWANFTTTVVPPPPGSSGPPIALGPTPDPTPTGASPATTSPTDVPPSAAATPDGAPPIGAAMETASPLAVIDPIDPAVVAGAQPALVVVAAITFALIIGGAWLAGRRRRPDPGR